MFNQGKLAERRGWRVSASEFRMDVNFHYLWPLKSVEQGKMELGEIYKHAPLKARLCLRRPVQYPVTAKDQADAELYRLALELESAIHRRAELEKPQEPPTKRRNDGELTTPSCKRSLIF